jgi:hypothetical protein
MTDERPLSWRPIHGETFRWLPRQGEPLCVAEWITQKIIKLVAYTPVYTAIVVTLVLLVQIFGVPFVGGK